MVFQYHKTRLVHTTLVDTQQAAHTQCLYLLLVKHCAFHAQSLCPLFQFFGKAFGVEVCHRHVHFFTAPLDVVPQPHGTLQLLLREECLFHNHLQHMVLCLRLVAVETIVGKSHPFHECHHFFGNDAFACHRHTILLLLFEHGHHLVGSSTQLLLHLGSGLLAIKIDNIYMIRQAVKHHNCIGFLCPFDFQAFQFLAT